MPASETQARGWVELPALLGRKAAGTEELLMWVGPQEEVSGRSLGCVCVGQEWKHRGSFSVFSKEKDSFSLCLTSLSPIDSVILF